MKKLSESIESKRAAIFFPYEHLPFSPSLDSAIRLLVKEGYNIDVVYMYDELFGAYESKTRMVRLLPVKPDKNKRLKNLKYLFSSLKFTISYKYDFLIGADLGGLIVAGMIAMIKNVPLVYYSLELLLDEDFYKENYMNRLFLRCLKRMERYFIGKASLIIIQDEYRKKVLVEDTNLRNNNRIVLVPNAYYFENGKNSDDIKDMDNNSGGKKIVIYAGSVYPGFGIKEIIEQINLWPDDTIFLLHTFFANKYLKHIEQLIKSHNLENKIWVSLNKLSFEELCSLIRTAHIGISFYLPDCNTNFELCPSGKVSFYLSQGIPIIVNNIPPQSVNLVLKYNCGIVVNSPSEVGDGIMKILGNYQKMSINAMKCYEMELEFSKYFRSVISKMDFLRK